MFGVVVNPVSGRGRHDELTRQVVSMLGEAGHESRVYRTQTEEDGERQTQLALEDGCEAIVCIGGDGTLSEVVRPRAGTGRPLYIVPNGTGNDFARALGLPLVPLEALRRQLCGRPTAIDCASLNGKPFVNVSGSGFDVEVLRKTEELKATYPGPKAYRKAIAAVLGSYRPFEAELSLDGGAFRPIRVTIAELANGQYIGGGMHVAPNASPRDGLLDVVLVRAVPRLTIPLLVPLFILGIHTALPIVSVQRVREVTLRARGMVVNIDGRLRQMDEARFAVLPGALTMMLPR